MPYPPCGPSLVRVRHKSERGCCAECLHYAGRNMHHHAQQQQMLCERFPQTVMKWPSDKCGEFEYHVSGR